MHVIVMHFQVPTDPSMKKIWQPNVLAGHKDPVFQAAMKKYFDMADDDKNGHDPLHPAPRHCLTRHQV